VGSKHSVGKPMENPADFSSTSALREKLEILTVVCTHICMYIYSNMYIMIHTCDLCTCSQYFQLFPQDMLALKSHLLDFLWVFYTMSHIFPHSISTYSMDAELFMWSPIFAQLNRFLTRNIAAFSKLNCKLD